MRSKAHIKTHPLHPILVAFPIAFFTGALVFDILAQTIDNEDFSLIAYYLLLAGVITALIAAVPGFIDFLFTVPPASSARKRAATHGILNLCMVALFTTALFLHPGPGGKSGLLNVILEAGGFVLMLFAGWMLGFDMDVNQEGKSHWHSRNPKVTPPDSFSRFIKGFQRLQEDVAKLPVRIYNVTDGSSRLPVFDRITFAELDTLLHGHHQTNAEAVCSLVGADHP